MYCVSCRMLARSARKVALPRSSSDACSARLAVETTDRLQQRQHALAVGLPQGNKPRAGGNPVRRQRVQESVHGGRERNRMRGADDGRPRPDRRWRRRSRRPSRSSPSQFHAARAISMNARPCADVSSWRSREGTKAAASSAMLPQARIVARRRGPVRVRKKYAVAKSAALARASRQANRARMRRQRYRRLPPPIRCRWNRKTRRPERTATARSSAGTAPPPRLHVMPPRSSARRRLTCGHEHGNGRDGGHDRNARHGDGGHGDDRGHVDGRDE